MTIPVPREGFAASHSGDLDQAVHRVWFAHMDEDGNEGPAGDAITVRVGPAGVIFGEAPIEEGLYSLVYLAGPEPDAVPRLVVVLTKRSGGRFVISDRKQLDEGRPMPGAGGDHAQV